MSAKTFDEILAQGIRAGQVPARTRSAREWFRNKAKETTVSPTRIITSGKENTVKGYSIGQMMLFNYDPKLKKELPYYDTFPLIFPIEPAKKGFLGINFHYLPPRQRALLMDALYTTTNNKKFDESTKLQISYQILKGASRYKYFKPCVKHYLSSHVKSRRILIEPAEWDICLFLPLQRFHKASKEKVWRESLKQMKK